MKILFTKPIIATTLKAATGIAALSLIAGGFFIFNNSDVPARKEGKGPHPDRPDLAMEQEIRITKDPATGTVPRERLGAAWAMIQQQKAQKNTNPSPLTVANWDERGPSNIGGRTRALMFDPNDGTNKKVWAGGVAGGLWYTNDVTVASPVWVNVDDFWANMAVSCIAYDPTNTQIFYVGTGEGWYNVDAVRGNGIWKTTDGGATWAQLSSTTGSTFMRVQDIIVDASGAVYAATRTGGIQRSTNGGTTWSTVLSGAAADLEKGADGMLYASIGIFTVGGIYESSNGTTWTNNYASAGDEYRIEIACAPSNANVLYAMVQSGSTNGLKKIMKSTNGGTSWASVTQPSWFDQNCGSPSSDMTRGQAWYDLIAAVHPTDENTVYIGGVDLMKTTNGGTAWSQISSWWGGCNDYVHADQHAIAFRPGTPNSLAFGNDGGVHYTIDAGATFSEKNTGYNVTQFYACAIHPTAAQNYFLAGAQDNGTQQFNSPGIDATVEVTGGDGAFCFIDQDNPTYQVSSYVYNNFRRSTNGGASFSNITSDNNGNFINAADYDDGMNILYSGYSTSQLYRVTGITGTPSPGTITITGMTDMASAIRVSQYTSGSTTLFVGCEDGKVFRVTNANGSPTSTNISTGLPASVISCIEIGASESDLIVTYSNYGVNSVWRTTNGGTSWSSKENNLPDMPIRWALYNPNNYTEVLVATEMGIWSTDDITVASPTWAANNNGLANVRVDMLQMRTSDNEVIAATHGRGLFSSDVFAVAGSPPVADFTGSPTTLCVGSNVTFTDASTNTPTSWSWNFQGGNPSSSTSQNPVITYTAAGTYSVSLTATNGAGNDNETKLSYITVNALPTPSISVTPSATVCNGTSVTLTASGGTTYSWAPGGQTTASKTIVATATATYTVTATNANGCTNTATRTITVNPLPSPSIAVTPSATICSGSNITLTASGGTTYSWAPGGQTTVTKTVSNLTTTTTYTLTATNANGCTNTATRTITVNPLPTPSISVTPSATICSGSNITLTASGGSTYSWAPGGQTTTVKTVSNLTTTTTYTLTATNANGCSNTTTRTITVNPLPTPSISVTPSATVCNGTSVTLTASGGITYSWAPGGQTAASKTIVATATATYTVTATNANGCTNTATRTITVSTLSLSMSKTDESCAGGNGTATATPSGGFTPYTYSWNTGGTTQTISGLTAGTYTCNVTNSLGCTNTGTVTVGSGGGGLSVSMSKSDETCGSGNGSATATPSGGTSPYTYSWNTGGTTQTISNLSAGNYTCTVTDASSCTGTGTVTVSNVACGPTKLQPAYCGITETTLDQKLYCVAVTGATKYRYRVTHPASGFNAIYTRQDNLTQFQMIWVAGIQYGKTYNVEVAAYVSGVWSSYGIVCTVTTPAAAALTKLQNAYCGITETTLDQLLYCVSVVGATNYQYRVTDTVTTTVYTYTRGVANTDFRMSWVTGVQFAKVYMVEVRAYADGVWGNYGVQCYVTTPATVPNTKIRTADCGATLAAVSTTIYCDAVGGATNYEYNVVNVPLGFNKTYLRTVANTDFKLSWVSGTLINTTYDITVRAKAAGIWGTFATMCQVTTGPVARMAGEEEEINYTLNVYPNPVSHSDIHFNIDGMEQDRQVLIEIYNMMGTKIYSEKRDYSLSDGIKISLDDRFINGVYFMNAIIDNRKLYQKFVVTR